MKTAATIVFFYDCYGTVFSDFSCQLFNSVSCQGLSGFSTGLQLNLVLLFGILILGGVFASRLFQKLHIPQVVGCIVVGIILGDVLGLVTAPTIEKLKPLTMFALGLIGFTIGSELRSDIFKKYGRQFFIILFSEGIGAFLLVGLGSSILAYFITASIPVSIGMGLVFGAISSATAPAATANVLWEYKTRGPLTAALLAIVALDDALALLLYRAAATGAKAIMGIGSDSVFLTSAVLLGEIVGAVILGILAGAGLWLLLRFIETDDKILTISISCLLIIVGISIISDVDPILPSMVFGITIANLIPRRSKTIFGLVEKFSPPVYIMFFVLAGAHIEFKRLETWVVALILVYVCCRVMGKSAGSWLGAKYSHAPATVRRYLGICLQSQAGVAIGLAILAGHQFNAELGRIIILVVMTATFVTEIIGPMLVKVGVKKAGEIGLNITEEDLMKTYTVKDVMDDKPTTIAEDLLLQDILEVFSKTDSVSYPVINNQSCITGIITIADIKEIFANRDVAAWLLACDVAEPVRDRTIPAKSLEEAIEHMRKYDLESIPVVDDLESNKLIGILDYRKTLRKISAEVLQRRKKADEMAAVAG